MNTFVNFIYLILYTIAGILLLWKSSFTKNNNQRAAICYFSQENIKLKIGKRQKDSSNEETSNSHQIVFHFCLFPLCSSHHPAYPDSFSGCHLHPHLRLLCCQHQNHFCHRPHCPDLCHSRCCYPDLVLNLHQSLCQSQEWETLKVENQNAKR